MVNGAYELLVRTARQFGRIILRVERQSFINECGRGGRTSMMFTQTGVRGDRGERNSTPGSNLSQGNPVSGKDGQLYRNT